MSVLRHKALKYGSIILCIMILIIGGWYIYKHKNIDYTSYKVTSTMEIDSSIFSEYARFADGIVRYTTEGISYIKSGKEAWNKSISIQNPIIDICEDYVVIAEQKANNVTLVNKSGDQWDISMSYPIIGIEVSSQGVVAAILDDGEANYIEVKDKSGNQIAMGRTVVQGDGYPIDISISNDGTKLVSSYLGITCGNTQSSVVFYNYSAVGQNEVDRIVGGFDQYKTAIVPKVEFISNNVAVAFGSNMFTIYSINQKPSIKREDEFEGKVESILYNKGHIGMVFKNDESNPLVLKTYSSNGDKLLNIELDYQYKGIFFTGDKVMMYNNNSCKMLSDDGVTRFETEFDIEIDTMFALSEDTYVIVTADSIQQIKLK